MHTSSFNENSEYIVLYVNLQSVFYTLISGQEALRLNVLQSMRRGERLGIAWDGEVVGII